MFVEVVFNSFKDLMMLYLLIWVLRCSSFVIVGCKKYVVFFKGELLYLLGMVGFVFEFSRRVNEFMFLLCME